MLLSKTNLACLSPEARVAFCRHGKFQRSNTTGTTRPQDDIENWSCHKLSREVPTRAIPKPCPKARNWPASSSLAYRWQTEPRTRQCQFLSISLIFRDKSEVLPFLIKCNCKLMSRWVSVYNPITEYQIAK
jgi:hypothetical protein